MFRRSLAFEAGVAESWGLLVLRVGAGVMLFYVHGWHKLEGGIRWVQDGTPWRLLEEIAAMHIPFPVLAAFAATLAQFVCAPLVVVGLCTRICGIVLTATLAIAVLQNLDAGRDPQLALLYVVVLATLARSVTPDLVRVDC